MVSGRVNLFLVFAIATLVVGFIAAVATMQQIRGSNELINEPEPNTSTAIPAPQSLSFAAMGDMLPHDSVVTQAITPTGYNFAPYFTNTRPFYKDSDMVFCNAETPVAGESHGITGYPSFNAPKEFARDLSSAAGCNLVNMATNHIYDKAQAGIDSSRSSWEALGVAASGANRDQAEQYSVSYVTKNGIKVAF